MAVVDWDVALPLHAKKYKEEKEPAIGSHRSVYVARVIHFGIAVVRYY